MVDENVVVGEVVTGRRIETVLLVSLVHGPEMSVSDAAGLVLEFVSCIPQVRGVSVLRSEEVVERQTVAVSAEYAEYAERAGWGRVVGDR